MGKISTFISCKINPPASCLSQNFDPVDYDWGTGIRGLMRGMATLPQGNQELLVVRDKVGRPPVSLG